MYNYNYVQYVHTCHNSYNYVERTHLHLGQTT